MRFVRNLAILVMITFIVVYVWQLNETDFEAVGQSQVITKTNERQLKTAPERTVKENPFEGELYSWVGKGTEALIAALGEPERKDPSAYQYTWWVYTNYIDQYVQFGIEDGIIKTIYAIGENLGTAPLKIGQGYNILNDLYSFEEEVNFKKGPASYTFELTKEDVKRRPLIKMGDNLFLQLYFDTFTGELSSVRILDGNVLLQHRPYAITYRGNLPEELNHSETVWNKIDKAMEQQVFNISNILRNRFNLSGFEWDEKVSEVAFMHSKDMNNNNYFSHFSQNGNGLKERLADSGLLYVAAGENIAAQYPDAAAVVEGWLNSEGHREALLTEEYSHLGVGVYRFYYTQNFLAKPI